MRVVLPEIASAFAHAHHVHVRMVFGASGTLVAQVQQGAPADLLITADQKTMTRAKSAHVVRSPVARIATNTLVIAVQHGNPKHIRSLTDLRHARFAQCAKTVPCGSLATKVEAANHVQLKPTTYGTDVAATLTQLTTGDVDAVIVYRTDAVAQHSKFDAIEIDSHGVAPNGDFAAIATRTKQTALSNAFLSFLGSSEAQRLFASAGFGPPTQS